MTRARRRIRARTALGVAGALLACAGGSGPSDRSGFPVPRAEAEFKTLSRYLVAFHETYPGDEELFRRWALPYGPLDLEVRRGNHDEANQLRNLWLGTSARTFQIGDPASLGNQFHCGEPCVSRRESDLREKLPKLRELVDAFRPLARVDLLASWGDADDYRVNDLFRIKARERAASASEEMGFVPSGSWQPVEAADAYVRSFGGDPDAIRAVLAALRELGVAAVVREPAGVIRVVGTGIGDNESGLLFLPEGAAGYAAQQKLPDGREIRFVLRFASDVQFYESS